MPLPAEMPTITLAGKWEHTHAGEVVAGTLLFQPVVPYLNDTVGNIMFVPDDVTVTLDVTGSFTVQLLPGNLDSVAQKGWLWRCITTLTNVPSTHEPGPFTFLVDKDAPSGTMQFSDVVPVD